MKFYGLALCSPSSNLFCLGTIADSEESVGYDFYSSSPHSDNSLVQLQLPVQHWAGLLVWPSHCCAARTLILVSLGTPTALGNRVQCRGREVRESWSHKHRRT